MSFDLQLTHQRALVSGAGRGVGAAVVELLTQLGAQIVATSLSQPTSATKGVHHVAADLSTAEGAIDRYS